VCMFPVPVAVRNTYWLYCSTVYPAVRHMETNHSGTTLIFSVKAKLCSYIFNSFYVKAKSQDPTRLIRDLGNNKLRNESVTAAPVLDNY
jgi:hypothetical protein